MESLNILFPAPREAVLRREPVPELAPGQLLVRSRITLVSLGTELICYERRFEPGTHWERWVRYPFAPGYSNVGIVEAVGPQVTSFRPGDRVAVRAPHRQLAVAEAARAVKVPDAVPDDDAAWFALAAIVQTGVRRARHALGDAVAVVGMGPLGQLAAQYAHLSGARAVIGVDPLAARLEHARPWISHALPFPAEEAVPAVLEITEGRGVDVVYDVTGNAAVFPAVLRMPRMFGTIVLLGDTGSPSEQRLTSDVLRRGLQILGTHDSHPPLVASEHDWWSPPHMAQLFFQFLTEGRMEVARLVTHRFRPEQAPRAYAALAADRSAALGVLFDWTGL